MLTFKFSLTQSAKEKAFINDGVLPKGETRVEISEKEFTPDERKLIVEAYGLPVDGRILYLSRGYKELKLESASKEAIMEGVKQLISIIAEDEAAKKEELKRHQDEYRELCKQYIAGETPHGFHPYNVNSGDEALDQKVIAERELREKEKAAFDALRKEEEVKAVERLRKWALDNGSEYLIDLIGGDYDWVGVARDEWVQANAPDGFSDCLQWAGYENHDSCDKPSRAALKAAKEMGTKLNCEVRVMRVKIRYDWHECLTVSITLPDGHTTSVEKRMDQ